ncbi:MAG: helix-turn-helix transcriptional regulator [Clostridia bacterium]|nr:helix-turn-helix transcriptional regulator [Clostridia bacterium]
MKNKISEIRKQNNLTQPQLAEKAKLSNYTALQRYERGVVIPGVDVALRLARALNTTVEELFILEDGD